MSQVAPIGRVEGKAVETLAREVMDDFRQMDPVEYHSWMRRQRLRRETLRDPKGFSQTRELMLTIVVPLYVDLTLGRMLGDPLWQQDAKNMEAFVRACPEVRINETTGMKCHGGG